MQSAVLICPADHRAAANAFAESMEWGPNNYSVPLSPSGDLPATHWGCRADVSDAFVALLDNPPQEALPLLPVVTINLRDTQAPAEHFAEVVAGMGLRVIDADTA